MIATTERFIASAISLVRIVPLAPTSAPAMIMIWLPTTNPAIATASPVNALSREITTGMSAPPIGSTIRMPNASAATMTATSSQVFGAATSQAPPPRATTALRMLRARDPAKVIGAPETQPWSLPAAISDPEKVIEPMMTSSTTGTEKPAVMEPSPSAREKSTTPTTAAAPPPTALKSETSCGIAVICTRRAETRPAREPTRSPAIRVPQPQPETWMSPPSAAVPPVASRATVPTIAAAMPDAESRLPRRAVAGERIRCRPSTKHTAAAR